MPSAAAELDAADVTIVVPVGGTAPAWCRSARSLARLDPRPGEILAVIDGPDDGLAAIAAEFGARPVVLPERGGPAVARNRGARAAGGDVLLFVDSDVEVPPDLAARVAGLFSARPGLAAVIGSYDDAPGDAGFLSQYRNLLHHFVHQHGREQASTFWAGCGAIRRQAFDAVGGFDERYAEPSIEDIELGSRLRRSGYEIHLVKDLQVKHLKRWRLAGLVTTDLLRRAVPWTELILSDRWMADDLNVKWRGRGSVLLALIALAALPAAGLRPWLLAVGAAAMILLLALNAGLFRFFRLRRGVLFALGAVPLYWLYLLICGLGFGLGLLRHLVGRGR